MCKCLDIECGQLQRKLLKEHLTHEAFHEKVKKQFFDNIALKNVYFVMGTLKNHPKSWTIIAILYLKPDEKKCGVGTQVTLTKYAETIG